MMLCLYYINKTTFNSKLLEVNTVPECITAAGTTTSYIIQSTQAFQSSTDLNSLLENYFKFDLSTFEFLATAYLFSFVTGHILGRTVSAMRKAG